MAERAKADAATNYKVEDFKKEPAWNKLEKLRLKHLQELVDHYGIGVLPKRTRPEMIYAVSRELIRRGKLNTPVQDVDDDDYAGMSREQLQLILRIKEKEIKRRKEETKQKEEETRKKELELEILCLRMKGLKTASKSEQ